MHPSVPPQQYREALALWPSGVTVVTAAAADGPVGMTAASFSSLSLDPPLVLVCIGMSAWSHDRLVAAPGFAVHILSRDQEDLSVRFSRPGDERFTPRDWTTGEFDAPMLPLGTARLVCAHHAALPSGDHTILVGRVVHTELATHRPLLYWNRGYHAVDGD